MLSYRYEPAPLNAKYLFTNKIDRWFTFEGVTLASSKSGRHLLITDLSNFIENVSRVQIVDALEKAVPNLAASGPEKLQIRNAIATLDRLLSEWTFSRDHDLPQNRDASAFLSNILLSFVDREMTRKGYDYYRYVDDIRIIADPELHARRALQDLIRQLQKVGLNINANKTEILAPDVSGTKRAEYFLSQDSSTIAINQMWQSRSYGLGNRYRGRTKGQLTGKEQRSAVSQVVQGTGSLIFKRALLAASSLDDVRVVLPMHDAPLFEHTLAETPARVVALSKVS
ncbi:RNA-directed DNA polymerase [Sphingomonas sp.]|uniref:RNA-directed DNA polymerase n=1 Tax=Sphingomonas sp. TaxID=28214 RepID=UPI0035BC5327